MLQRYNAVVYAQKAYLEALAQANFASNLVLTKASSPQDLLKTLSADKPDVVVLDYEMQGVSSNDLTKRLRLIDPAIPILFVSTKPDWSALEREPLTDMVKSPIDANEALHRIFKLLNGSRRETTKTFRLPQMVVENLRGENGRIDAKLVADLFGISIPALAKAIKTGLPALYKTSDSRSVQEKLVSFERIAWGLLKLTGSKKGLKIWLNAPNPDLDEEKPIDLIKEGYSEDIAAMVEDALLGHPS